MKVTEKHMITTNEFEVQRWNIDTFMKIKIMGIPKIHKNDDGKIYAIDLLNHDGSTKTRFIFEDMTNEENEKLEKLLE